ncbi:hypothetical protein TYRP_021243 [Tyrophagus putrescentiae]|nr:hypothetical protein TYRP_021243 [Tyrophagus putrescentiae]
MASTVPMLKVFFFCRVFTTITASITIAVFIIIILNLIRFRANGVQVELVGSHVRAGKGLPEPNSAGLRGHAAVRVEVQVTGSLPHAQPVAVSVDDIDELGVSRPEAVPAGATLEGGAGRVEAGNPAQRPLEVLSRKGDQVTAQGMT